MALAFGLATGAQALTIEYNSYVSGEDLGTGNVATLELTQVGDDVTFLLTNTLTDYMSSFIESLGLDYDGIVLGLSFTYDGGVYPNEIDLDDTPPSGNPYNIVVGYNTSNKNGGILRLNPNEFSEFTILDVNLEDFNFASGASQIHLGATRDGQSTKYTGTQPAPVPLPAAGVLLIGGLAGMAGLRRRSRAA